MKYYLINETVKANCAGYLSSLPVDKGFVVSITKGKRTLPQNALWHKWIGIMAEEAGYTLEDMKTHLKREILGMKEFIDPKTGEVTYRD